MALAGFVVGLLAAILSLLFFSPADAAGGVGVNYGRVANDLPDPASVVNLLKQNGITMVRIYDADPGVLRSFANTGIKMMVMLPNEKLADAARDRRYALDWVRSNVSAYYPATQIHALQVGNEVFDSRPDLAWSLVPAMDNLQRALADLGLADAVKVSTPVGFAAVAVSWPPSDGRFRDDVAEPVMRPMLEFLQRTGSYLTINLYPYFAYADQRSNAISRDFFLGNPNPGERDPKTGLVYYSLLDAQLDATYFAMDKLGFTSLSAYSGETGTPASGGRHGHHPKPAVGSLLTARNGDPPAASKENAQAYNNNVINRVLSGRTGTPHRPDADMDVYIFALFNENQKGSGPDDIEQHFGLFYPNQTKVYEFDFHGGALPPPPAPAPSSWCVANEAAGDARLLEALNYACANGADCSAIQPGAPCFEPDTMVAHASYAFNSYYQRNGRASGTCDFAGAAYVVYNEPAGTCDPNTSWCVANEAAGDARLLEALNYACANGADCGAIQPGAACFEPNTMVAHASYAFNSYYQRNHRASGTCDFAGTASVVYHAPKYGNCVLPSKTSIEQATAKSEVYAAI
ncbi:glucan endo-1,3-beta-glucosidase 13-like [Panicum virgatum]|uniref:glucan endo-1,3-beta-D-glucosidase n=2 Tax=Panicum virgatum TaxID=38727 RepID=A0A8T0WEX3_PANVG|nr:glucan endo-1,3-beta-glucosidase 13-like [Panicum virgatum]KAG2645885.1 hypothetical protein PVAP13_2KG464100 [Panicum virgatum]